MLDEMLMGYLNLVREFPEYEYELKYDAPTRGNVRDFLNSSRYSRSDMPEQKEMLISHYCGDVVAVQRISKNGQYVLASEKKLFELKTKGKPEPVSYGIKGEKWVMKRKEKVEPSSLADIIESVQGKKFEGSVLKKVDYDYVMDRESGRVFELAYARMDELRPVVAQLEVEYVGLSVSFNRKKHHNERQLISDLIDLGNALTGVTPTKKNKREFISR